MKKIVRILKNNYMHLIAVMITISFLLCSVFVYQNSFIRIKESGYDIYTSFKYYVANLTDSFSDVPATITMVSKVDIRFIFPVDWETFERTLGLWWDKLFTEENLYMFLDTSSTNYLITLTVVELLIIIGIIFYYLFNRALTTLNVRNEESKQLKQFKVLEIKFGRLKAWIVSFKEFLQNKKYLTLWLAIWLYNLNFFTIICELIAFIFYFPSTFDILNLYVIVYKLFFDLMLMFKGLPVFLWIIIGLIGLNVYRHNKAISNLEYYESYNTGFVKSLPSVNVVHGLMGSGKGQVMTDIVLTKGKTMREDAKETLEKFDRMFPYFPFVLLESTLKLWRLQHRIFSLSTIEKEIEKRKKMFYHAYDRHLFKSAKAVLWGYDFLKYGLEYNNNLYMVNIFNIITEYAQAYFVYTTKELNISNYAIRSDGILEDFGNFPLWNYDFFNRNPEELDKISTYGHILDQDILRRGKKVNPNNPFSDTLEFGVVVMTELDKERGNQFVEKELKFSDEETNQKNDLFNFGLKLDRHSSTIDFKHYMFIIFDLQRLNSTNADLQECGGHLGVGRKDKKNFVMPLFFLEEFFAGLLAGFYTKYYSLSKLYHADNTLLLHLIKKVLGGFYNYYDKMYNLYGYDLHHLQIEDLSTNTIKERKYFLLYKKNHALRYYTDSLVDYFRKSALNKNVGIDDYPSYSGVKATKEEFSKQNSYFQQKLNNVFEDEKPSSLPKKLQLKNFDILVEEVKEKPSVKKLQLKKPSTDG